MRALAALVALLASLVPMSIACSGIAGGGDRDDGALEELETLTFVPAGRLVLAGYEGYSWANCSIDRPLLFDRYELSLERLDRYRSALVEEPIEWSTQPRSGEATDSNRPAPLSLPNAKAVAAARGMRLPTPAEWLHVALGGRSEGFPFPWGTRSAFSGGNTLELSVGRSTPIGTFEGGRSRPHGCYDLVGNLWEWVDGHVPGYDDESIEVASRDGRVSLLGGAYDARLAPTHGRTSSDQLVYFARTQDKSFRAPNVGARMCADAEAYLVERAPLWSRGSDAKRRVIAVGSRWGRSHGRFALERLLERISEVDGAPAELSWLVEGIRQ